MTAPLAGVKVAPLDGLLVEFAVQQGAHAVVRGLRAVSDFEFNPNGAENRKLEATVETIFLHAERGRTTSLAHREGNRAVGGDVGQFVPACVVGFLREVGRENPKAASEIHLRQIPVKACIWKAKKNVPAPA
jgi:pantetheine-phosphate adenylyltransferase